MTARALRLFVFFLFCTLLLSSFQSTDARDKLHQPKKVMDAAGVKPGMIIGEVGAGYGYFTFKLVERVGESGKIYANDISARALRGIRNRCELEGITNIETILGKVDDPLLPQGELDIVFIVNAFHDLEKPVALLNNLAASLKPNATVVILDRDPAKIRDPNRHLLTREEVLQKIKESVFVLERIETFLVQHSLYIIRLELE